MSCETKFSAKKTEKVKKKNSKKNSNGLAKKALPCGNGSYNFEKDTKLQREKEKCI